MAASAVHAWNSGAFSFRVVSAQSTFSAHHQIPKREARLAVTIVAIGGFREMG